MREIEEIRKELDTAFTGLSFEPSTHTYSDKLGTKYKSCTEFVKGFESEKDWDGIQQRYAQKHGLTVEAVKEDWAARGKYATTLGTEIHAVMEHLWKGEEYQGDFGIMDNFPGMAEDFAGRKGVAIKLFDKLYTRYQPVANEYRIFDQELRLAGTVDFIAQERTTGNLVIIDWKSSKKFDRNSYKSIEKMKYPFSEYDDCNVNHYSLQLSLYRYIIERQTNLTISKLLLFQLPKAGQIPDTCICNDMCPGLNILFNKAGND